MMTKTLQEHDDTWGKFSNALQTLIGKLHAHLLQPPGTQDIEVEHHDKDLENILGVDKYTIFIELLSAGKALREEQKSEEKPNQASNPMHDLGIDTEIDFYISKEKLNAYKRILLNKSENAKAMTPEERLALSKSINLYTLLCCQFLISRPNYWR